MEIVLIIVFSVLVALWIMLFIELDKLDTKLRESMEWRYEDNSRSCKKLEEKIEMLYEYLDVQEACTPEKRELKKHK